MTSLSPEFGAEATTSASPGSSLATSGERRGDRPATRLRVLRVELGRALIDEGRIEEGTAELRSALAEVGEDPSEAVINVDIARALTVVDPGEALDHLITAARATLGERGDPSARRPLLELVVKLLGGVLPAVPTRASLDVLARSITPDVTGSLAVSVSLLLGDAYLKVRGGLDAAFRSFQVVGAHDPDQAIGRYSRVLERAPDSVDVLMARAEAWSRVNEPELAAGDLEQALELAQPTSTVTGEVLQRLAIIDLESGHYARAAARLDAALDADAGGRADRLRLRAQARLGNGDPVGCLRDLDDAAGSDLDDLHLRAQALLAVGDEASASHAEAVVDEITRLDPVGTDTLIVRAQLLLQSGGAASKARELLRLVADARRKRPHEVATVLRAPLSGRKGDPLFDWFMAEYHLAHHQSTADRTGTHRQLASDHLDHIPADADQPDMLLGSRLWPEAELDRTSDRVEALSSARWHFQQAGDWGSAVEVLEELSAARPNERIHAWRLADSYGAGSYQLADVEASRQWIAAGITHWERAFEEGPPDPDHRWAFATRAVLADQEGRLRAGGHQLSHAWQAICYQELAVADEPENARRKLQLDELFEQADLSQCRLDAVQCAIDHGDADDLEALWQLGVALLSAGHVEETLDVVATLRARADLPEEQLLGVNLLEAFIFIMQEVHVPDAVQTMRTATERLSLPGVLAEVLDRLRDPAARDEWEIVATTTVVDDSLEMHDRLAWALYRLGRAEQALDVCEQALARTPYDLRSLSATKGFCLTALGRVDAGVAMIKEYVLGTTTIIDVDQCTWRIQCVRAEGVEDAVDAALADVEALASARRRELSVMRPDELIDLELEQLDSMPGPPEATAWARLAAALVRARRAPVHEIRGHLDNLDRMLPSLPERPRRLGECAREIYTERLRSQEIATARSALVSGNDAHHVQELMVRSFDEAPVADQDQFDEIQTLAGYASFVVGVDDRALALSADVVRRIGAERVSRIWADVIADGHRWSDAVTWLDQLGGLEQNTLDELGEALPRLLHLEDLVYPDRPRPIVVALGDSLLPDDPYDPDWPFIKDWLQQMREDIQEASGLTLPGIRARRLERPEEFTIELSGAEVERWRLSFAPGDGRAAARVPLAWPAAAGPIERWRLADREVAQIDGDPLRFVVRRLDLALRAHLDRFVTVDSILRDLEDLDLGGLPLDHLHVIGRVTRAVAREGIHLREVMASIQDTGFDAAHERLVAAVRAASPERPAPVSGEGRLQS